MQCGFVESSTPVKHTNVGDNGTSPVFPTNDSSTQSMKETSNAAGHQMVWSPSDPDPGTVQGDTGGGEVVSSEAKGGEGPKEEGREKGDGGMVL